MSRRPLPFDGKLDRSVVLVGLMGAGKSTVGRRLARRLGLPFVDSDSEIEDAAGLSAGEVFKRFGERDFRDGERRIVARLASGPVRVIATGGGAFVNEGTRALLNDRCITIWLDVPVNLLAERTARRPETRPMLADGSRSEILARLNEERRPAYAQAHIRISSEGGAHHEVVDRIIGAIERYLQEKK
jgi:shikimate kinase